MISIIQAKTLTITLSAIFLASLMGACSNTNNIPNNINKNTIQNNNSNKINSISKDNISKIEENKTEQPTDYSFNLNKSPIFIKDFLKQNPQIGQSAKIVNLLEQQVPNQSVIKLVSPATQTLRKNWLVYRSKFIEPMRLQYGVDFWQNNKDLLTKVEKEFGVDAFIIVGIIGIESIFGRHMGNFNVLNTLYTLAFYYPQTPNKKAREEMFQSQLASYLLWADKENNYNHNGSYAGAIGMPQFMPQSINKYAIDYDKDGVINLNSSIPDVVASVANFLKQHGWKTGENTILDIEQSPENLALLKANATGKPLPSITFKDMPSLKFDYTKYNLTPESKFLIVDLPSANTIQYKIGLPNFYTLTRYNQSFFYALSVYELGQAIALQIN